MLSDVRISADFGTSREVVSRMLEDLEQRALLKLRRGRIELGDPEALQTVDRLCD